MRRQLFSGSLDRRYKPAARAVVRRLRAAPRKLNDVARLVRGLPVASALSVLRVSRRRLALDVKKALVSAVANAENNQGVDAGGLYVVEATVGREMVMKRLDIKGRSRAGRIEKPFSSLRLVVGEVA